MTKRAPGPDRTVPWYLQLARFYHLRTPIARGRWRVLQLAQRRARSRAPALLQLADGRRLYVARTSAIWLGVFLYGDWEPVATRGVRALVRPGDVCLDVGANLGWHTTLLHRLVGPSGQVHAFEPVPTAFENLARNVALAGDPPTVTINQIALSDRAGSANLHLFAGLGDVDAPGE